ncbi:MAG: hypothetical protein JHC26_07375 [Thermofilum sp.]|jgi:hypothetical protein|uniref:hypothetical protein n=1 Tax=Thermofilum sp. TaxID=1961369 RepID=UPI0025903C9C|nr:hypothetical protein [Thermofilum sp.]MCI4408897.1 hypothetical protein [Thermofilum sp.]
MNNNKKVLLGLALSILLVLALFVVHPLARNTIKPAKLENKASGPVATFEVPLMNIITIKVYRSDGRVETYQKVGDPWTQNFMAAMANFMFVRYNTNPLNLYARDGQVKTQVETESTSTTGVNPYLAIGVGSGSLSPSFYDVDLSNPITLIDVAASGVSVTDNGTHIIASYSVSYTASSAVTVSEVGLYWKAADYNSQTYRYYLFARDVLSTPISLSANDVLAITYTITFKYNQPPMTYNFAALMFDYLFGLKYYNKALTFTTTDGTATNTADYGMDDSPYDQVKEYAKIKFGSGVPSFTAKITDVRNTITTTNSVQVNANSNSTHFYFTLTVGYPFTSATSVSEVALIIDSIDIDPSTNPNAKQLLLLYFPISNTVNVPAGGAIKFQFTIAFKISP